MLKRDEMMKPFSCLNQAGEDEPIFVLRAHDECAPSAIRYWADQYKCHKEDTTGFTERERKKYAEALMLADIMRDWWGRQPKESALDPSRGALTRKEVEQRSLEQLTSAELVDRAEHLIKQFAELTTEFRRVLKEVRRC